MKTVKRLLVVFLLLMAAGPTKAQSRLSFSIPFKLIDNRPFIEVVIKKHTYHFILDCGAGNALDLTAAQNAGLELTHPTLQGGAGAKRVTFWLTRIDTINIGPARLCHADFQVTDFSEIQNKLHLPYLDGVIGYNFMKDYAVQFDYPHARINFYKSYQANTKGLTFDLYYGQIPAITVNIDGAPARVIVDTGDRTALTLFSHYADKQHLAENYRLSDTTITGYGIGGAIYARRFMLKQLQIATKKLHHIAARVPALKTGGFAATDIDGSIGGGVLKNYKFTVDYLNSRLYFE